jgi:hypothetical protein
VQNNIELAATTVTTTELRELSLRVPPVLTSLVMPSSSGAFTMAEYTKAMQIDADDPAKTVQIGASLNPK